MHLRRFMALLAGCGLGLLAGCPLGIDFDQRPDDGDRPGAGGGSGGKGNDGPGGDAGTPQPDGGGAHQPGGAPQPGGGQAAPAPVELVGKWQAILTYVPVTYTWIIDPGDFSGSLGVTYTFTADGQYRYELSTAMAYFGGFCFRSSTWSEWGGLTAEGAEIALAPARATNVGMDSCGDYVFDDDAPTRAAKLGYAIEAGAAGRPVLRLRFPSGEDVLLERQ